MFEPNEREPRDECARCHFDIGFMTTVMFEGKRICLGCFIVLTKKKETK